MSPELFNKLVDVIFDDCKEILTKKAGEYADTDRLSNFKKAARVAGNTPEQALMCFRLKHEVALMDFVNWIAEGKEVPIGWIEEKVKDLINYNILLLALIAERNTNAL
jgi:hypothetical protein